MLTTHDIQALTQSPQYQAIPIQQALESGFSLWWAQQAKMTRAASEMALWEVATAMEACFAVYCGIDLSIRMRFVVARDREAEGSKMEMWVNDELFDPSHPKIVPEVWRHLVDRDGGWALRFVHDAAHHNMLPHSKPMAQLLHEALFVHIKNADHARAVKALHIPEMTTRIDALALQLATPTVSSGIPARRM